MKTQIVRHNLAQKIKLFGLTALATVSATCLNIEPVLAQTVFATGQILGFQLQQGQSQWAQSYRQQVGDARWEFYPNGSFVYVPGKASQNSSPLQGTYQNHGNSISFNAERSYSVGSGSFGTVGIYGEIKSHNGQPVLNMQFVSGTSSGANINGTPYGFSKNASYQTTVILHQLQ